MTAYLVYDVFTDTPFGGNQLAIFPDAEALPQDKLQAIAAEFNFSEVTFVYPPDDLRHTAKVRIFTPTLELPFAGHPLIGTATALADLGFPSDMTLELGIGPMACRVADGRAQFTTTVPLTRDNAPDPALVAQALGLTPQDIVTGVHAPVQAGVGVPFVVVKLVDRAALSRCQPDVAVMRIGAARYPSKFDFALLAYTVLDGVIHARMFAPLDNIPEDPATGSAAATLAALLFDVTGAAQDLTIHQGTDMGRPSVIYAQADATGVTISGQAVRVMEGQFLGHK
ncbi:PhzF family phenazine biosynthesis protein [Loktanella salsilacus]|uniref:PhzF family phenazine biosynthesis protein n=1 Tax=Loktanella salsilacus TaxID=195913 RepID=UPI003735C514